MRHEINHFIECSCQAGGVLVTGIDFQGSEEGHEIVTIAIIHKMGMDIPLSFWRRLVGAWDILWGREISTCDVVLGHSGVTRLRDACQDSLDRWPEFDDYMPCSLDSLYQEFVDEDRGRKMREEDTND